MRAHHSPPRPATLLTLASLLALVGCASQPLLRTVPQIDLLRMEGTWYVTHHIPYWLEEGKVATADIYRLRPDGRMDNTFVFRRGSFDAPEERWNGVAWVHDTTSNAHWKVRFIWPFSIDYLIIDQDPDYAWVAVGHPSRDYFWILSRTRSLPGPTIEGIMTRAVAQGYDRSRFAAVPQPAE
jgi:apolipoprotein D and lipocalin family protein